MNASDYEQRLKTTGRNDPCPCGSGRKYKKCHLAEDEAARHKELAKAAEEREAVLEADAKTEAEEESSSGKADSKLHRNEQQRSGHSQKGQDRHTNIPRRGAI